MISLPILIIIHIIQFLRVPLPLVPRENTLDPPRYNGSVNNKTSSANDAGEYSNNNNNDDTNDENTTL